MNNKFDPKSSGNSFSLLLFVIPLGVIAWAVSSKVRLPFNQLELFKYSLWVFLISYIFIWLISFRGVKLTGVILLITAMTSFLWLIGTVLAVSLVNQKGSEVDHQKIYYRKVTKKYQSSGSSSRGPKSSPSCTVWFDKKLFNVDYGPIKYSECDVVDVDKDGVMYTMQMGSLGFPWVKEHSVIKNFDFYIKQLNIDYENN